MSYLPNARILAKSIRHHHPDWDIHLLLNDHSPDFIRWEEEPFDSVTFSEWLDMRTDWNAWAYDHSVVEFCTGTKGAMSQHLFEKQGYDAVVYLDPDTVVFSPLLEVMHALESKQADVILTPHLTDREFDEEAVRSHEMAALKHGTFNLGFFVIANTKNGREYLDWWSQRLIEHCYIDFESGLFTDQKWCNLVPYLFDGVEVFTHRTYNTATWNMTNRALTQDKEGAWLVNGELLRFYHFSGFGNDFAWADRELEAFTAGRSGERAIWSLYKELYEENRLTETVGWHWGKTRMGRAIDSKMRRRAREKEPLNPYEEINGGH